MLLATLNLVSSLLLTISHGISLPSWKSKSLAQDIEEELPIVHEIYRRSIFLVQNDKREVKHEIFCRQQHFAVHLPPGSDKPIYQETICMHEGEPCCKEECCKKFTRCKTIKKDLPKAHYKKKVVNGETIYVPIKKTRGVDCKCVLSVHFPFY